MKYFIKCSIYFISTVTIGKFLFFLFLNNSNLKSLRQTPSWKRSDMFRACQVDGQQYDPQACANVLSYIQMQS